MLYSPKEIPVGRSTQPQVFTPDDIAAGRCPRARWSCSISTITIWAGCSPSIWPRAGIAVSYVTPAGQASAWTIMTNELPLVHRQLARHGVSVDTLQTVTAFDGEAPR